MPVSPDQFGLCPAGSIPLVGADGSIECWFATDPGFIGAVAISQKGPVNPNFPGPSTPPETPAPAPAPTTPPAAPPRGGAGVVSTPRQPGAPAVPFIPPGRIGLWGGGGFLPVGTGGTTVSTSTESSAAGVLPAGGLVNVDVANTVNLADNSAANAVGAVAGAVDSAISTSLAQATSIATTASQDVISAIAGQSNLISGAVNEAFTSLVTLLKGIETGIGGALGNIGTDIGNSLTAQLEPLSAIISILLGQINKTVGSLGTNIAAAVAAIIPQILQAISNPLGALSGVLGKIEGDIGTNLKSLTQIPGAIADASTSLDGALARTLAGYETFTEAQTGWGTGDTAHSDLSDIWKAIAGLTTKFSGAASPKLADYINPICESQTFEDLRNKKWLPPDEPLWGLEVPQYVFMKGFASIAVWLFSLLPAVQKAHTAASQKIDFDCPQELLQHPILVEAVQRGILSLEQAQTEAQHDNLSPDRFEVLRSLAIHQMAPEQLVEALYRGITSPADFSAALSAQGWTTGQQNILQALGVSLLTVAEALELFRRQTIDQPTLDAVLKAHQYDDAQRKALISLAFRPTHLDEAVDWVASADALTTFGFQTNPSLFTAPEYAQTAGAAEGLDSDTVDRRWISHWNTGSLDNWVALYFRGQITFDNLQAQAGKQFIPPEILPVLIEGQRPLVQFRTIQTMLHLNLLTDAQATILLKQHGYSPENINILLAYAHRPPATKTAVNAARAHEVSLGIAKAEYIEGSIDRSQYAAILSQHGYTLDGVNVEIETTDLHQAMLRRRENLQLIVDEYGAGLIDEKAALAQLAVGGFTVDELAKAAHKIRAFRAKVAKQPTEAELHSMLKAGVITNDQYVAALTASGYSNTWAQNFLAWRTQPTSAGSSAAVSTPAPTGG